MSYIERLKRWEPSPDAGVAMLFGVGGLWVALILYLLAPPPWVLWLVGAIVFMCAWTWVEERWPWILWIVLVVGLAFSLVKLYADRDWSELCTLVGIMIVGAAIEGVKGVLNAWERRRREREDRLVERITREVSRTIRE